MIVWSVYRLVDPRTSSAFYIGCTSNTLQRLSAHNSDPASSAWRRCRELRDSGLKAKLEVIEVFPDKDDALDRERELILSTPDLVNRSALFREGAKCWPGCLCGKHNPTRYTGNPNWFEEYSAKRSAVECQ